LITLPIEKYIIYFYLFQMSLIPL